MIIKNIKREKGRERESRQKYKDSGQQAYQH